MFETVPAAVLAADLSEEQLYALYAEVAGRIERHLDHLHEPPLVLVDGRSPRPRLAELEARLTKPGLLDGIDVVLTTSGSRSSAPHLVGLSWEAILASANATRRYLGTDGTWWLALVPHRVSGLQVIVRSVLSGTMPALSAEALSGHPGSLYTSLVPTQLARISPLKLQHFTALLIGGARLDPSVGHKAQGLPLVTTYGMTETCGGCVYNGVPLPGVEVRVEDGRVLLGGATLMTRYLDEPSPFVVREGRSWLATADLGLWEDGALQVTGRADDVIISGGENVSAFAVADAITAAIPSLEAVEVLGIPDADWGQLVVAAVVTGGDDAKAADLGPRIRAAVTESLGKPSAPRLVVLLPSIPLLPEGKLDKGELLRQVNARVGTQATWRR